MSQRRTSPAVPALITVATVGVAAGAAYLARTRQREIKGAVVNRVLERPAGRSSYTELAHSLESSGTHLTGRAERAADTHANRETLAHIIGIERWGQYRLGAALGKHPDLTAPYHAHRPPQDTTLPQLQALITSTRAASVDLARRLHTRPPGDDLTIHHNSLGALTAKAWLRYLIHHADLESRRLRGPTTPTGLNETQNQPSATKL